MDIRRKPGVNLDMNTDFKETTCGKNLVVQCVKGTR